MPCRDDGRGPKANPEPPCRVLCSDLALAGDGRCLVRGLNWAIQRGQSWLLTGPSGSGKTLLALALCGRVRPLAGQIEYASPDGATRTPFPDETTLPRRAIVYAGTDDQRRSLGPECFYQARWHSLADDSAMTVATALSPAALFAVSPYQVLGSTDIPADFAARRHMAVQRLRLEPLWARTVAQLSSGERRRLLLAQALARAPQLLLLDDPFDGLDASFRQHLREVVGELVAAGDPHLVLITPRPDDAAGLPLSHVHLHGDATWTMSGHGPGAAATRGRRPPAAPGDPVRPQPRAPRRAGGGPAAPLPDPLICLRDVTVRYGNVVILDRVCWQVRPGENWLITGPNGSGKTTLLGLLARDNPQAYSQVVEVLGRRTDDGTPIALWRRAVGVVSPELLLAYPPDTPCRDVVLSGAADSIGLFQAPRPAVSRAARALLGALGLSRYADEPLGAIPEGAQRLILLARALVKRPRLLLLDEPCQGLDDDQRWLVRQHVDAAADRGVHVIYVAHHHEDCPRCLTHALRLEGGRVTAIGPIAQPSAPGAAGP